MKKFIKVLLIIVAVLVSLNVVFSIVIRVACSKAEKEDQKIENKTILISDKKELNTYFNLEKEELDSIVDCKIYYTPTQVFWGIVMSFHESGNVTVTEKSYVNLLNKYDDWQELSKLPELEYAGYQEGDIYQFCDDGFIKFIQNNKFLYSQKCFEDYGELLLLSEEEYKVYFFIDDF